MLISEIDFPKSLVEAQRAGNLVIFAGAGVSIPAPSNYPNFIALATKVASGVLSPEPEEPTEHFLGRLSHRGVAVHSRVREMLSDPKSMPNSMHFDLLKLFPNALSVRIVTTNFDLHFSTASNTVFGLNSVEVYSAPALPLGHSFSGLIYLHGSVDRPAERLVLTDSDFGRAYLTEGWARRFLQQVFAQYMVLFVGYSYQDTVMQYLTRGLPPETAGPRRYALTKQGQREHWGYLGITPLEYALSESENPHCKLPQSISKWASIARIGVLQQEEKIKGIVEQAVPLNPEDLDYIEAILNEISTARFFTRYARRADWLLWLENKLCFARLFQTNVPLTDVDEELARWFARFFFCVEPDVAIGVVRRKGGQLTPLLWTYIAQSFHTEKPSSDTVQKLTPLLIRYPTPRFGGNFLEYTIFRSKYPDDATSATLLFDYLTRPDIVLKENIWADLRDSSEAHEDIELTTSGSEPWIDGVWASFFKPNLSFFAHKLVWIVTSNIQRAYALLQSYGKIYDTWDPISARRSAVESSSYQGTLDKGVGTLIDAARDIFLWASANDAPLAEALISSWFSSGCRILQRLAIYGVSEHPRWTSDEKIHWVLDNQLIYRAGFKHELFVVLNLAYPSASKELRKRVLDVAAQRPDLGEEWERTSANEEYNLVCWLADHAPECEITQSRREQLAAENTEFQPRKHPDFDSWVGPVIVGWKSPKKVEDILAASPSSQLEFLITFQEANFDGPSREGLLQEVIKAIALNFGWGLQLAHELAARKLWSNDLWRCVIEGWKSSVTAEQWRSVLDFLKSHPELHTAFVYNIANLLEDGIEKPDRLIPAPQISDAVMLAEHIFAQVLSNVQEGERKDKSDDWLMVAINHPAGTLTMFLLRALSREREINKTTPFPDNYRRVFNDVIAGKSYAAELARVALCSQILFLFNVDDQWTIANLVPLMDWKSDPTRAKQCWDGYLTWGQWNNAILPFMLPMYETIFPYLHSEFERQKSSSFCGHMAGIALLSSINPLDSGWLERFLRLVDTEEREMWASNVGHVLSGTTEDSKAATWNGWMQRYWNNRNQGVPLPLSATESAAMLHWAMHLGSFFPDAVEAIFESPRPKLEHSHIFYEFSNSDIATKEPKSALRLLHYLLQCESGNFSGCEYVEKAVAAAMKTTTAEKALTLLICDELARLGCKNAAGLRDSVIRQ
jgi:hypothetical protein